MRAKAHIEEAARGRLQIIVTELPYQVNKATLLERIAELVKDGKIDGISDLRDESDRSGMRIVIELKREAQPKKVLNKLYKHTRCRRPSASTCWRWSRRHAAARADAQAHAAGATSSTASEVITRRTEFELEKARARAHILEGLKIALDNLDEVIRTIRESRNAESARNNLMRNFKLSRGRRRTAILDMQLRRLAALERKKIEDEYKEVDQADRRAGRYARQPAQDAAADQARTWPT